ncbi:MAG: class I SAM-dependent methyltransferase [Actinomycetota bacterium]
MIWLDPQPHPAEIHRLYRDGYYTDSPCSEPSSATIRFAKRAFSFDGPGKLEEWVRSLASVRSVADGSLMWLGRNGPGRLLDVGCGTGAFLERMRDRGWSVIGIEPDSTAAESARARGLDVRCTGIEDAELEDHSFDAITMSHVIEHVSDPVETLRRCNTLLSTNGRLVIVTPNSKSLGRKLFGNDWLGWDVPRHLHLFDQQNLATSAVKAGLAIERIGTTARSCFTMLPSTKVLTRGSVASRNRGALRMASLAFWMVEHLAARTAPRGEEILLIARRGS